MSTAAPAACSAAQRHHRAAVLPSDNALRAYARLLMGGINRDWTAQEVLHNLMGLPGYKCDVCFERITLDTSRCFTVHDGSLIESENKLKKYFNRCNVAQLNSNILAEDVQAMRSMCVIEFFHKYSLTGYGTKTKLHKRNKKAVVRIFPRPPAVMLTDKFFSEEFCRCAVIACIPIDATQSASTYAAGAHFNYEEHVLTLEDGTVFDGKRKWAQRLKMAIDANDYWVCRFMKMRRVDIHDPGWGIEEDAVNEDDDNVVSNNANHHNADVYHTPDDEERYMDHDMEMGFPGGPMVENDDFVFEEANVLGASQEEAQSYDKALHFEKLSVLHSRGEMACNPLDGHKFLQGCVKHPQAGVSVTTDQMNLIHPSTLTDTQRKLVDIIDNELRNPGQQGPGCIFVGKAGTGKSLTIKACQRRAMDIRMQHSMKVAASTGKAGSLLNSVTVRSLLACHVPASEQIDLPDGLRLGVLQQRMREVKILLIDEMSMIGLCLLGAIDARLRQIMCKPQTVFGGVFVVLCGDIGQLPPVCDIPLWTPIKSSHPRLAHMGHFAYYSITQSIVLNEVQRQTAGPTDRFIQCLHRCREGTMRLGQDSDVEFLATRYSAMLPPCEKSQFLSPDIPLLAAESSTVATENNKRLLACEKPVAFVKALDVGRDKGGPARAFSGLESTLMLCDGARVLLIADLNWNLLSGNELESI
eukprot:GHVR01128454.1.p1 GENE.GHVR01128454.1~~GHVR01128454.1.p1  ORF type:complete len:697 (+),score=75.40 GHVR01128454.1:297-2387(+)